MMYLREDNRLVPSRRGTRTVSREKAALFRAAGLPQRSAYLLAGGRGRSDGMPTQFFQRSYWALRHYDERRDKDPETEAVREMLRLLRTTKGEELELLAPVIARGLSRLLPHQVSGPTFGTILKALGRAAEEAGVGVDPMSRDLAAGDA